MDHPVPHFLKEESQYFLERIVRIPCTFLLSLALDDSDDDGNDSAGDDGN